MSSAGAQILNASINNLTARARLAAEAAGAHAASVDAAARFPSEAFAEIRKQRLLGVMVPPSFGGEGASVAELADVCFILGQACSSAALIFAMHQIKMACIIRHHKGNPALERILRQIAADQLLMASSTTEGQAGGNVRSSEAAIEHVGDDITLERKATVISYAMEADGIVTTARRAADAAGSDQVLVVLLKKDYTLERLQSWDTLGMRGTHSEGFTLKAPRPGATDPAGAVREDSSADHGAARASFVGFGVGRHRRRGDRPRRRPSCATRCAARAVKCRPAPHTSPRPPRRCRTLRGVLSSALRSYQSVMSDEKAIAALEFQSMITMTKVQASELAVETVLASLRACGLSGFRNDSEFSIGRHLRDVLSAPLMINNDRILANLAMTSVMTSLPTSISG